MDSYTQNKIMEHLAALMSSIAPTEQLALGSKSPTGSWDAGGEYDVTVEGAIVPEYVEFKCDGDVHIIFDNLEDDPTTDPSAYPAGISHRLRCKGKLKMHFKLETGSSGTLNATVFGTAPA